MRAMKVVARALLLAAFVAACSSGKKAEQTWDPAALPTGPVGESIAYGRALILATHSLMKGNVRSRMACAACHIDGGLRDRGGTFVGVYSHFPQWNKRAHRVITLQDRLAECFLYSMNGTPPSYSSKEMTALVAYIAWLSRGVPAFSKAPEGSGFVEPLPSQAPDPVRGAKIYVEKCATCHGADGNGAGQFFPPLWGPQSFNNLAGMAHLDRMTGFVRYNMPQDARGTLSQRDAYDVSAWVLAHKRPVFLKAVLIRAIAMPAAYF